jgi:hypothetical protein
MLDHLRNKHLQLWAHPGEVASVSKICWAIAKDILTATEELALVDAAPCRITLAWSDDATNTPACSPAAGSQLERVANREPRSACDGGRHPPGGSGSAERRVLCDMAAFWHRRRR